MGPVDIFFLADDEEGDRGGRATRLLPGRFVCEGCPVAVECGAYAIVHHIQYGVWGGMDPNQRRRVKQRYGL